MRIRSRYLAAAGAVAALFGAPAAAADQQSCTDTGSGDTVCSTPGNVQINDSPQAEDFTLPYWDETFGGAYPGPYPVPYAEGQNR